LVVVQGVRLVAPAARESVACRAAQPGLPPTCSFKDSWLMASAGVFISRSTLLVLAQVAPTKLTASGYQFQDSDIAACLANMLS
jgi:Domain of unknown function (DUF1731)